MFYSLNNNILLRGWDKLPFAFVNTKSGNTTFVDKDTMKVLELCTGTIDFGLPLITDEQRKIADTLEASNIIRQCAKGETIQPIQEYRFYQNRYIRTAHWSLTGRCNYKCRHCYMSAANAKLGELSHEAIMNIVDQLADCGVFRVSLTGGEPLVRSDFLEIVDALTEHNICIETIYSNGLLVNDKLLNALKDRGLSPEFNMSFDGTEGWHDWLRGIDFATNAIDKAFRLCREYGFSTAAEMCIHEKNKHTLRDSINHLASRGCRSLKTNPVTDVGAWKEGGFGQSISTKDLLELYLDYIPQYYKDGKPMAIMLGGLFSSSPNSNMYAVPLIKSQTDINKTCVCGHARNVMYISPESRTLPCFSLSGMEIQKNYPLITEKGLRYCISDSNYMHLIETHVNEVIQHNERCRDCEYINICHGGCRASALETTPEDILGIDECACAIFKDGYIDRLKEVVARVSDDKLI